MHRKFVISGKNGWPKRAGHLGRSEVGVQVGKILEAAAGAPFIESGDWERSGKA